MKSKFLAVILSALTIPFMSCDWFRFKAEQPPSNPLIGTWHLDSLQIGKDSGIVYAFIAMAMQDPVGIDIEFRKDTIFTFTKNDIDTSFYRYDAEKNQLLPKDSSDYSYIVTNSTDLLITLQAKDSSVLFLKKR